MRKEISALLASCMSYRAEGEDSRWLLVDGEEAPVNLSLFRAENNSHKNSKNVLGCMDRSHFHGRIGQTARISVTGFHRVRQPI
jgi:hypothetical protein